MKVTVQGMICGFKPDGAKDKDGKPIPVTDIYSDGDIVNIRCLSVDPAKIGTQVNVLCELRFGNYEGRSYHTFTAINK